MNVAREQILLYAVTDRSWLNGHTLEEQVEQALKGGVSLVQLREKKLDWKQFYTQAVRMKELCARYQVPLIINDNVEIAIASGADGVHVGQGDMQVQEARARLGPDKIIGVSARTVEQALQAQEEGADYLGVGAVFGTSSKEDAQKISIRTLQKICSAVDIPVAAIGGINKENARQLSGSGISGIAVISALFAQKDIRAAAEELKDLAEQL